MTEEKKQPEDIRSQLLKMTKELGISSFKKPDGIEEVMKVSAKDLSNLSLDVLNEYLYSLAQYANYLNYQLNGYLLTETRTKKTYRKMLDEKMLLEKGGTKGEKEAMVLQNCPELIKYKIEYENAEIKRTLLNDVPKMIIELVNTLKIVHRTKVIEHGQK